MRLLEAEKMHQMQYLRAALDTFQWGYCDGEVAKGENHPVSLHSPHPDRRF